MTNRRSIFAFVLCGLAATAGCATGGALPTPDPADIPEYEAAVASDPGDLDAALLLASAYREAGRAAEARSLISARLGETPDDPGLVVMAGLLDEDAADFAAAQRRYEDFLEGSPSGRLADEVSRRLEIVRAEALKADVRASLDREAELSRSTPDAAAIGVFPFAYDGNDPQWSPLGVALAELLTTDLAITGRLRVLERVRVQALLDEMALADAGMVQSATAARSGRLLGSGQIVQGRYRVGTDARIGIDAAVVKVGAPGTEEIDPLQGEDAIERLFDLEKRLALDIHDQMGISLTPAERSRIDERQTENVQALLAFGRGLMASDQGDFAQAEAHFSQASALDPSFAVAASQAQSAARRAQTVTAQATRQLSAQASRLGRQRAAVQAIRNAPASVRQQMLARLGQRQRAVLAEVLGQDRLGTAILLELVFRSPGGAP